MNSYIIYRYVSPSGKCYIGQTCNLKNRQKRHKSNYNNCRVFSNSIAKYGYENFEFEILEENLTLEEANIKEEYYISFYNSLSPNGYNLKSGGLNNLHAEETKLKISSANFGRKHSSEMKLNLSKARKGIKHNTKNREENRDKYAKSYMIIFPDGTKKEILNLKRFCEDNFLTYNCMSNVVQKRQKSHKGYGCERLN